MRDLLSLLDQELDCAWMTAHPETIDDCARLVKRNRHEEALEKYKMTWRG